MSKAIDFLKKVNNIFFDEYNNEVPSLHEMNSESDEIISLYRTRVDNGHLDPLQKLKTERRDIAVIMKTRGEITKALFEFTKIVTETFQEEDQQSKSKIHADQEKEN